MKIKHLQLPFALALALGASNAHALGLGQIEVKSGLNEPLVAEIPILSAGPGELGELEVRLASPEAFARVGLERPVGLTANLQMSVGRNAAGQPVVRITTPGRFSEPYLTFLIEANWGRGSLVREYSALVDPPYIAPAVIRPLEAPAVAAYSSTPPPPVYVPEAEAEIEPLPDPEPVLVVTDSEVDPEPLPIVAPEPETVVAEPLPPEPVAAMPEPMPEPVMPEPEPVMPEPEPEVVASAEPEPLPVAEPVPEPVAAMPAPAPIPVPEPAAASDSYGPVTEGQTLWSLAQSVRPDSSVTVNQMMLALQRANPEAFINDNINQLKRGAVLRIPARDDIVSLGEAEAAAVVREQANAWQARRQPVPQPAESVAAEPAPEVATTTPARPARTPGTRADGRLEIVPPSGDEQSARAVQSGASGTESGNELRAELTQAREDLAAREAEVAELRSQLTELEQQQADTQRLIQLQDSQMKALQERLGQEQATPVAAEPAPVDAAQAGTQPVAAEPAAAAPWYMNLYVIGGGILVLLAGLVLALRGRRNASPMPVVGRRISEDDALAASLANNRPADDDDGDDDEDLDEVIERSPEQEALATLKKNVANNPDDLEAHISLLRHHYSQGQKAQYEVAAQAMRIKVRSTLDPRWREAVVMGVTLSPSNPLFSQAGWNSPRFGDTGVLPATPAAQQETPVFVAESVPDLNDLSDLNVQPLSSTDDPDEDWDRLAGGGSVAETTDTGEFAPVDEFITVDEFVAVDIAPEGDEDDGSSTKIELAKAYLDIGDVDGAKGMLEEVLAEAGPAGRAEAERLLKEIG